MHCDISWARMWSLSQGERELPRTTDIFEWARVQTPVLGGPAS
jgi:hypothetical protein